MKLLLLLVLNHILVFANALDQPVFNQSDSNFENVIVYSIEGEQVASFSNILLKNKSHAEFVSLLHKDPSIKIGAYIIDAQAKEFRYQRVIQIK